MKPYLLAIVGGSGSGKSRLARKLLKAFGARAGYICLDDFYRDQSHLHRRERDTINYDHPKVIDWKSFRICLQTIVRGKPVVLPSYDFTSHTRHPEPRPWQPKPLVILDGLWLLHHKTVRRLFNQTLFVDCPESVRLSRRLKRDRRERGRAAKSIRKQFMEQVAPMHERFVAGQSHHADLVLSSPVSNRQLAEIVKEIRTSLTTNDLGRLKPK
jgi:uridine kinase